MKVLQEAVDEVVISDFNRSRSKRELLKRVKELVPNSNKGQNSLSQDQTVPMRPQANQGEAMPKFRHQDSESKVICLWIEEKAS